MRYPAGSHVFPLSSGLSMLNARNVCDARPYAIQGIFTCPRGGSDGYSVALSLRAILPLVWRFLCVRILFESSGWVWVGILLILLLDKNLLVGGGKVSS